MGNIKDYRENELKYYVIANLLVFFLMYKETFISEENFKVYQHVISLIGITMLSSVIFIFTLLADSMISSDIKTKLVNPHIKIKFVSICNLKQHGSKIFSEIRESNKDNRFIQEKALEKYKDIYSGMPIDESKKAIYENSEWYKIYDRYREDSMISTSNRDYLLMRDMYISTGVLFILYAISVFIFSWFDVSVEYILYLFVMLLCTWIATRMKSKRLVYNVIAIDLRKEKKEGK